MDLGEFEAKVKEWTSEEGLSYSVRKFSAEYVTNLDEERNPFWAVFKHTLETTSGATKVTPQIFPAGTDSRFLRKAGIPVIGFSPLNCTPVLLHDHNERVSVRTFLKGVHTYVNLIPALANLATVTNNAEGVYMQPKIAMDQLPAKNTGLSGANQAPQQQDATTATTESSASSSSSSISAQTDLLSATPIPTQTDVEISALTSHSSAETQTTATSAAATPIATQTEAIATTENKA